MAVRKLHSRGQKEILFILNAVVREISKVNKEKTA